MATPLVRIPQPQGGTMYAFASSARDITRAFNSADINFEFSKYALLDLPDFTQSQNGANAIDFKLNLKQASGQSYVGANMPNVDFAQTFQNYALNLEELLLNDDDYDPILLQSDAEKIFFKWLSSLGAIDFRPSDSNESSTGDYAENDNAILGGANYERVVKYLGSIDAENDVAYQGNTYHEVYINVPTSVGFTPQVLFKPTDYNTTATKLYPSDVNAVNVEGREGQTHPDPNIDLLPIVDQWTLNSGPYYDVQTNATNSVQIDFDTASYEQIQNNPDVKSLLDYAKTGQQFRFNAVLVYYDLYSSSVPANRSTNLYGILILDDITDSYGPGSKIHEQIKFKPNEVTGLNGNAYSLKLNLKFNSSLDNVGVETSVNDFTTFSMDLFMDTTTALENATDLLLQANNRYGAIAERLTTLENIILGTAQAAQLETRIKELEDDFTASSLQLQDSDALLTLINNAHGKINQLIDGTIPVELQYNTDVIFAGKGTTVDKSVAGKIKVNNEVEGYVVSDLFKWDIASGITTGALTSTNLFDNSAANQYGVWAKLNLYTNRLSLNNVLNSESLNSSLDIYIDDSTNGWKKGQVFKIAIDTIDVNGNNIKVLTNKSGGWINIADIDPSQLITTKPYIELVCIDPINYVFEVDILR
jgi:hypothetical protein|tara:strand:+ start:9961 stop:11901 length:1941 start_codon:yes stop_codon:yes gene_type:complete